MNLTRHVLRAEHAERVALAGPGLSLTHRQLAARVEEARAGLGEAGVGPGDAVAVVCDRSVDAVVQYLAALASQAVLVPLPPQMPDAQLTQQLALAAPVALSGPKERVDRLLGRPESETVRVARTGRGWARRRPSIEPRPARFADGVAAVFFTSGSTGQPRGVLVGHDNLVSNTEAIVRALELRAGELALWTLPLSYCFGASVLHTHLRAGGGLWLGPDLSSPAAVADALVEGEVDLLYGVPTTFALLAERTDFLRRDLPRLRAVAQAGGRLDPQHVTALHEAGRRPYVMYGQTEATARLTVLPPGELPRRLGAVGFAVRGTRLSVRDLHGRELAVGEPGEVVAQGPGVCRGYLGDADASAEVFRGGALFTGDRGWLDDDGCLWLLGRERDLLTVGGGEGGSDRGRAGAPAHAGGAGRGGGGRSRSPVRPEGDRPPRGGCAGGAFGRRGRGALPRPPEARDGPSARRGARPAAPDGLGQDRQGRAAVRALSVQGSPALREDP